MYMLEKEVFDVQCFDWAECLFEDGGGGGGGGG